MVLVNDNSTTLHIGDPLPHFTLPAVDGLIVESRLIKDPVLAVIFTCNHCPYAKAYEDRLIALAARCDGKGVQFVLINSNDATDYPDDSLVQMQFRAVQKAFPFPYCQDETQEVAKSFGALCTPHCFVGAWPEPGEGIKTRTLQYKGRIDDNWKHPHQVTQSELEDALMALIDGREPHVKEKNAIGCSIKWRAGNNPVVSG